MGDGWKVLASRTWSLMPGKDDYFCTRVAVKRDLWVTGVRALAPTGTHHVTASIADDGATEGDFTCARGNLETHVFFAAGAKDDALTLPLGVALHLLPGQRVTLGLHGINTGDEPNEATSGIEVALAEPSAVAHEAEVVVASAKAFAIPPHAIDFEVTSRCAADDDFSVVTSLPILHRLGAYERATATSKGTTKLLYEGLFTFGEERAHVVDGVAVLAGDPIDLACTYTNLTSLTVKSGPDASDEACAIALLRYPASGGSSACAP